VATVTDCAEDHSATSSIINVGTSNGYEHVRETDSGEGSAECVRGNEAEYFNDRNDASRKWRMADRSVLGSCIT
jgi:hypothetical protein